MIPEQVKMSKRDFDNKHVNIKVSRANYLWLCEQRLDLMYELEEEKAKDGDIIINKNKIKFDDVITRIRDVIEAKVEEAEAFKNQKEDDNNA